VAPNAGHGLAPTKSWQRIVETKSSMRAQAAKLDPVPLA